MNTPLYIGDELSASGYRLAGIRTHVPDAAQPGRHLERVIAGASLVLIGADIAQRLPEAQRRRLLAALDPPVVVVPDIRARAALTDLATYLRKQLGVLE